MKTSKDVLTEILDKEGAGIMRSLWVILRNYANDLIHDFVYVTGRLKELLSITFSMMAAGCWHRMGPPRTIDGVTYRACLECGAQRLFDLKTWEMYGPYSYRLTYAVAGPSGRVLEFKPADSGQADPGQPLKEAA